MPDFCSSKYIYAISTSSGYISKIDFRFEYKEKFVMVWLILLLVASLLGAYSGKVFGPAY